MLLLLLVVSLLCVHANVFSADLRSFLSSHDMTRSHCGISFDVVRGSPTTVSLFQNPQFKLDPFVAQTEVRVTEVSSMQQLFHELAAVKQRSFVLFLFLFV
jgi:hypothetical protein